MEEKINLAVIGLGRIGKIHSRNIKNNIDDASLAALVDISSEVLNKVSKELNVNNTFTDYNKVIKNDKIDGVLICSATHTHPEISIAAANEGKHVFCEKPIALEMDKINEVIDEVKKNNIVYEVGFNRRYDPNFRKAKKLIEAGEIGEPEQLIIISHDPEPPSEDYIADCGGIFLDMTIHDFDMARYMLGEEIKQVMATGNCLIKDEFAKHNDVDTAVVSFISETGYVGSINNSRRAAYGYDNRVEILGAEGSIAVGNQRDSQVVVKKEQGIIEDNPMYFFTEKYEQAYIQELRDFVDCIKNNKSPLADEFDGKMAVKIGHAANSSLFQKKAVNIDLD